MIHAVIMAGGRGERLWPLSTPERPKQFLKLFGERTMLQHTVDRIRPIVSLEHMIVVTGGEHADLVREQLPELPGKNVIAEPFGRGTAACIGLSSVIIRERDPDALMMVLAADHRIEGADRFRQLLQAGLAAASDNTHLVTLGITPHRPETGYGYILAPQRVSTSEDGLDVFRVERFVEKPDPATAKRYLEDGAYYWNSGMFLWHVDAILNAIERHMPQLSAALANLAKDLGSPDFPERLREAYEGLAPQSIDRGVMEKSDRVLLIPASDIGWSDVGGWEALREILDRVDKPWGHEHLWALNQDYAGKFLHINAGESLSLQYHATKDETIYVMEGKLRLRIGEEAADLEDRILLPGDRRHIPPRTIHQMEALENCVIAEVSTPHLTDVVRLEDRYGR